MQWVQNMKRFIIHDLNEDQFEELFPTITNDMIVLSPNEDNHHCLGCFGCWIKTPGQCVIKDNYNSIGEKIAASDEVIIISRCVYGGYSPKVKKMMDRSIPYLLPFFVYRKGMIHHGSRYKKKISFRVFMYNDNIVEEEKEIARSLIKANAINLNLKSSSVDFAKSYKDLGGILL